MIQISFTISKSSRHYKLVTPALHAPEIIFHPNREHNISHVLLRPINKIISARCHPERADSRARDLTSAKRCPYRRPKSPRFKQWTRSSHQHNRCPQLSRPPQKAERQIAQVILIPSSGAAQLEAAH